MTKNQMLILDIIRAAPRHFTAEQIFMAAREKKPGIAMATVYNSLSALVAEGQISRLHILGQADRYDRETKSHAHLVCKQCGAIADRDFTAFLSELEGRIGLPISSYELNIHCLCKACRKQA